MRLSCPHCGGVTSLELLVQDGCARGFGARALSMPPEIAKRLMLYLSLHASPKRGALPWDRAEKLLAELAEHILAARVTRHGRTWAAPLPYWAAALDQILDQRETLRLPLKGHGYLYEIVAATAQRAEGRGERQQIDRARGVTPMAAHPSHRPARQPDEAPRQRISDKDRAALRAALKGGAE